MIHSFEEKHFRFIIKSEYQKMIFIDKAIFVLDTK